MGFLQSHTPVTIVATGPLSNIAYAIRKYGATFENNVEQIIIMGIILLLIKNTQPE